MGTLAYMSPEQLGGEDVDQRTDVFSLGIVLFELLLGHHPIALGRGWPSEADVHRRMYEWEPTHFNDLASQLPRDVWTIIRTATARRAEARYASMINFKDVVQTTLQRYATEAFNAEEDHGACTTIHSSGTSPHTPEIASIRHARWTYARGDKGAFRERSHASNTVLDTKRLFPGANANAHYPFSTRKRWWGTLGSVTTGAITAIAILASLIRLGVSGTSAKSKTLTRAESRPSPTAIPLSAVVELPIVERLEEQPTAEETRVVVARPTSGTGTPKGASAKASRGRLAPGTRDNIDLSRIRSGLDK